MKYLVKITKDLMLPTFMYGRIKSTIHRKDFDRTIFKISSLEGNLFISIKNKKYDIKRLKDKKYPYINKGLYRINTLNNMLKLSPYNGKTETSKIKYELSLYMGEIDYNYEKYILFGYTIKDKDLHFSIAITSEDIFIYKRKVNVKKQRV